MNKKAMTGKALTFFVFIIIVVVMAIFVTLSTAISILKTPTENVASLIGPTTNNLLLKTISVTILDQPEKEMLVHDAVYLRLVGEIKSPELSAGLDKLQDETGNCYLVQFDRDSLVGESYISENDIVKTNSYKNKLESKISKTRINTPEESFIVSHYIGLCP